MTRTYRHTLSLTFSIAVNFIQQFASMTQKSNSLFKTWLRNMPVSRNDGEVILLILVYFSKMKDLSSGKTCLEYFSAILAE